MMMDAIYRAAMGAHVHMVFPSMERMKVGSRLLGQMTTECRYAMREDAILFDGGLDLWCVGSIEHAGVMPTHLYIDEVGGLDMELLLRRGFLQAGEVWWNPSTEGWRKATSWLLGRGGRIVEAI